MSLPGFDTLRARHPHERAVITRLESYIETTLRKDVHAVIDDAVIEQQLPTDAAALRQFLVELVERGALKTQFFWICPITGGTTKEATDITLFPSKIECSQCGQRHVFSQRDIEVNFVPSEEVIGALLLRQTADAT